ncbi:MAG: PAS domain S-box protein, partial [Burkholderiales bacterium]
TRDILHTETGRRRERALARNYQSSVSLPLFAEGRCIGAISIYAREADAFDADEITVLSTLAQDISYGIDALRLRAARERDELNLRRLTRARSVMAKVNHALVHAEDESGLLQQACHVLVESGSYCLAWVGLAQDDAHAPIRVAAAAGGDPGEAQTGKAGVIADGGQQSMMEHVIATGKAYVSQDLLSDAKFASARGQRQRGYRAAITLPLTADGHCIGGLGICASEAQVFDAQEIDLLEELANDLAYGIRTLRSRVARERAEASAHENEQRLRAMFEQAAVGITRVDLDGVLLEVNQKFCDMLGYRREELLGRRIKDITHPDDYGQGAQYRMQLHHGETKSVTGEKRFVRKDGTIMWARRSMSVARDAAGNPQYVISVVEDITQHKEMEERFRATFEQAAVGLMHSSLDRRFLLVNRKFCDMLGYTADELLRMSATAVHHPEDSDKDRLLEQKLIAGEIDTFSFEKRYIRKDGRVIWANRTVSLVRDDAGRPKYFIRVVEDITARKEAEQRYRATFDSAPVGIMHTDVRSHAILHANPKLCEILGYTREELLSMTTSDIPHPDFVGSDQPQYLQQMLEGRMASHASERLYRRKDGSFVWVNRTISLVRDPAGNPLYFIRIVEDISDRKRAVTALRESEEKFRQLADNIPEVFWIADIGMRELLYLSPLYEKVTGMPVAKAMKHPHRCLEIVHPEDRGRVREARRALPHGIYNIEYRVMCPDGSLRWVHDQAYPVRDGNGNIYRIAGIAADITQRKAAEERLVYLAHYDDLTGLPNRVLFRDRLEQTLAQARRRNWLVGVMMLDLDRFKVTNDSLGHSFGDSLLKQVAARLQQCVRVGDTVGRFGGDEFGIVLNDLGNAADARLVAQKVLETFSAPFPIERDEVYITASIGISMYPMDSDDLEVLIKSADTALHRAKDAGRNNFQFYTAEMNARILHRMNMENSLRRALERREFLLHYQPKASLTSGITTGVEALLRWQHPEYGLVLPGEFVPLLEETGMIIAAGEWVFGAACAQIKAWQEAGIQCVPVAVNLSGRQLLTRGFSSHVRRLLDEYGTDPQLLEIEITESSLMANTEDVIRTLEYLESIGVRISVDDFGTGYSSLSYLKRFPLDALKIDSSFVREITTNAEDATIVRAIISMASSLGLKVVAEGVETEAQMNFLAANGCDEIQGYHLSRPMAAEQCGEWLMRKPRLSQPLALRGNAPAVLLVDDDEDMLILLMRALSQDGYFILTAYSAEEAFEVLSRHKVDVVVADQQLPGMSGVEFLQRVKSLHPATVRIMCSALADFRMVSEAVNKGEIFRFVPKDMDPRQLRQDVRDALSAKGGYAAGGATFPGTGSA